VDISVLTEDGTTIPMPIGTYKTEDGVSFRVEEEGVVSEVIESETEEEVEARKDDEEYSEMAEAVDLKFPESEAEKADWAKSYEEMKDKVDNLMDAIADIKSRLGEGDSEDVEMAEETPEVSDKPKTIKTTEVKEFSAEEIEAIKAENEKLKTELAASPADTPINTNKFSSESNKTSLSKKEYGKLSKQEKFLYNLYK
jgi:small-conductance mechanosensitive channel